MQCRAFSMNFLQKNFEISQIAFLDGDGISTIFLSPSPLDNEWKQQWEDQHSINENMEAQLMVLKEKVAQLQRLDSRGGKYEHDR